MTLKYILILAFMATLLGCEERSKPYSEETKEPKVLVEKSSSNETTTTNDNSVHIEFDAFSIEKKES